MTQRTFTLAGLVASRLPGVTLPPLAVVAAILQLALSPRRARAHHANLKKILPESRRSWFRRCLITFKALRSFGLFVLEFFGISRMDGHELIRGFSFGGLDEIDIALRRGRGVIIVTSHIGNWEAGARALAHLRYRLHVVAGIQFSRSLSPHVKSLKEQVGVGVVSPGPGEYRRLIDALRANEIIALVVDGDTFERGIDIPFFHGTLKAPAGPARLAALTGASIISTHVVRSGPLRFDMDFHTLWKGFPSTGASVDGGSQPARDAGIVRFLTRAIMKSQEVAIGKHIDQWCIFRPLWSASDSEGDS